MDEHWKRIADVLDTAVGIAWDGCHKIYVLMDEPQFDLMDEYGYDPLLRVEAIGKTEALETLRRWYEDSCGLRFINSVRTVAGDPNDGFADLIAQFEDVDV
jgi:hypothetical protein